MVLIFHIFTALLSLVYAVLLLVRPSQSKLYTTYGLVLAMVLSGTYLVFMKPSHLAQVCITGLIYLTIVTGSIFFAHNKLAAQPKTTKIS